MSKFTVNDCKLIAKALSEDIRIARGSLKLSYPDDPKTIQTLPPAGKGWMIMIIGNYVNDGEDLLVSQKSLAYTLSQQLGVDATRSDFQNMEAAK